MVALQTVLNNMDQHEVANYQAVVKELERVNPAIDGLGDIVTWGSTLPYDNEKLKKLGTDSDTAADAAMKALTQYKAALEETRDTLLGSKMLLLSGLTIGEKVIYLDTNYVVVGAGVSRNNEEACEIRISDINFFPSGEYIEVSSKLLIKINKGM